MEIQSNTTEVINYLNEQLHVLNIELLKKNRWHNMLSNLPLNKWMKAIQFDREIYIKISSQGNGKVLNAQQFDSTTSKPHLYLRIEKLEILDAYGNYSNVDIKENTYNISHNDIYLRREDIETNSFDCLSDKKQNELDRIIATYKQRAIEFSVLEKQYRTNLVKLSKEVL